MGMSDHVFDSLEMLQDEAYERGRADERKACAKVCSDLAKEYAVYLDNWPQRNAANECARMILERSNSK